MNVIDRPAGWNILMVPGMQIILQIRSRTRTNHSFHLPVRSVQNYSITGGGRCLTGGRTNVVWKELDLDK